MKVAKWGDGLAVRLPVEVVEALGLKEGDDMSIARMAAGTLELHKVDDEQKRLAERRRLIAELHSLRGLFPADFKFDREEANAR